MISKLDGESKTKTRSFKMAYLRICHARAELWTLGHRFIGTGIARVLKREERENLGHERLIKRIEFETKIN